MKSYDVYVQFTSSIMVRVNAEDREQAEELALEEANRPKWTETIMENMELSGVEDIDEYEED